MSGVVTIVCISHQVTQWFQSRPVILQFAHPRSDPRWGICKAGQAETLNMRVRVSSKVSTVP